MRAVPATKAILHGNPDAPGVFEVCCRLGDVVATRDGESQAASVGLINDLPSDEISVKLRIHGFQQPPSATGRRIHGPSLEAFNVPGEAEMVTTTELPGPLALEEPLALPACSITVLRIEDQ